MYLLGGETDWLYESSYQSSIYDYFDAVEKYNGLVDYNSRIAGVSYDAEIWNNKEYDWRNNNEARYQQIKYIETVQDYAKSKELSAIHCLPYWLVQYSYTDDDGVTHNMYDKVTQIANNTILMLYRDTSAAILKLAAQLQKNAGDTVVNYAYNNDCNLEIAVETNSSTEGAHVTFYEEEQAEPGCVLKALDAVRTELAEYDDRITFAIHHAIVLYENYLSLKSKI